MHPFTFAGSGGQGGGGGGGGAKNMSGPVAARPAATGSGAIYLCTDFPALYLDDPSSGEWQQWAITPAPSGSAANTWTVVGNLALQAYGDAIRAAVTQNINGVGNVALQAIPGGLPASSPWMVTLTGDFLGGNYVDQYPEMGVIVANGATNGVSNGWGITTVQGGDQNGVHAVQIGIGNLARLNAWNEALNVPTRQVGGTGDGRLHLRLLNDGASLHCQQSGDGFHWLDWYALATPTGLTHYGFYLGNDYPNNNAIAAGLVYGCLYSPTAVKRAAITGATNATPIVVTAPSHGFKSGDLVSVNGVVGNTAANTAITANGFQPALAGTGTSCAVIQVVDANSFELTEFAGSAPYTSGGIATLVSR